MSKFLIAIVLWSSILMYNTAVITFAADHRLLNMVMNFLRISSYDSVVYCHVA